MVKKIFLVLYGFYEESMVYTGTVGNNSPSENNCQEQLITGQLMIHDG